MNKYPISRTKYFLIRTVSKMIFKKFLETTPLRSDIVQRCSLSPLLSDRILELLATTSKKKTSKEFNMKSK